MEILTSNENGLVLFFEEQDDIISIDINKITVRRDAYQVIIDGKVIEFETSDIAKKKISEIASMIRNVKSKKMI